MLRGGSPRDEAPQQKEPQEGQPPVHQAGKQGRGMRPVTKPRPNQRREVVNFPAKLAPFSQVSGGSEKEDAYQNQGSTVQGNIPALVHMGLRLVRRHPTDSHPIMQGKQSPVLQLLMPSITNL
eukprot:1234227-Amphidinium_carterae.1